MTKKVSIIIRSKNEERWIKHCLIAIKKQSYTNYEIILVDNESADKTVSIAHSLGVSKILQIKEFYPGLAINMGIEASSGEIIVCISSHCIPKSNDWLEQLISPFTSNQMVAGVYGRQLPLSFTSPSDARDLLLVFGNDFRIQKKDYFFHNANSAIRKDIWENYPFDSTVTNIEDRLWGKSVISAGYCIAYNPKAAVYHHHGLHHGNKTDRLAGVFSLLKETDGDVLEDLPTSLMPENLEIYAILPIQDEDGYLSEDKRLMLRKLIKDIQAAGYVKEIFVCCFNKSNAIDGSSWINRSNIINENNLSIDELLNQILLLIEINNKYSDYVLYANYQYIKRPKNFFQSLIKFASNSGFDTLFPAVTDFGHYWHNSEGIYKPLTSELRSRKSREPIYKAFYGIGTLVNSSFIRKKLLIGENVGIYPLSDKFKIELRR